MKCYITETLIGIFAFDDNGNPLNFMDFNDDELKAINFYESLDNDVISQDFKDFISELKDSGFNLFIFDNHQLKKITSKIIDLNTELETDSLEFRNIRLNLEESVQQFGIVKSQSEILAHYKRINEELVKKKVSEAGGKEDVIIIQIIESLEIIKKTISLLTNRLREWYGLHFPELTDKFMEDIVVLAKIIYTLGDRSNFTLEKIEENFDFNERLKDYLIKKAAESMGSNINLKLLQDFANQILSLDLYRQELEKELEDSMNKTAPNLNSIVGSLIGAKLIASAGTIRRLAFMPASRIQLLGAEKALYRFLKTGEKRPKHGLIFQWNQIRGSRFDHRGKIARLIAGKISIAIKIDYFLGEFRGDTLAKEIVEKINEIKKKYPEPPERPMQKKRPPQRRGSQKRNRKR